MQDHGGNLFRHVVLALDVDDRTAAVALVHLVGDGLLLFGSLAVGAADEALDGRDGVLRVRDRLVLSGLADHAFAVLAEADDGRGGAVALGVDEDFRLSALHDRHGGVRSAKVDADNLAHVLCPFGCGPAIRAIPQCYLSVPAELAKRSAGCLFACGRVDSSESSRHALAEKRRRGRSERVSEAFACFFRRLQL